MRWIKLIILYGFSIFLINNAQAAFNICNYTDNEFSVAVVGRKAIFMEDRWTSGGWFRVVPGDCYAIHPYTNIEFLGFISVINVNTNRIFNPNELSSSRKVKNVEQFFCVSTEPFDRRRIPLKEHRNCPKGWHLHLFNYYLDIPGGTNFTLNLYD